MSCFFLDVGLGVYIQGAKNKNPSTGSLLLGIASIRGDQFMIQCSRLSRVQLDTMLVHAWSQASGNTQIHPLREGLVHV